MAFPTFDEMIEPLLRVLASAPDGLDARTAQRAVADRLNLSDADRQVTIASGQALFANRAGWAHDRLKRAGLSSSPRRGWWQLTERGVVFARRHTKPLNDKEIAAMAYVPRDSPRLRPDESDAAEPDNPVPASAVTASSPAELIDRAVNEIRESVTRDLLERIMNGSPAFFEMLVLDLLHAMGYGTSRDDLQRVGGSGDGGIDGIISLDRLGLEKVYVQAKRWSDKVGSPEIQTFMGALQLQHASKGVFLTTSGFTRDARETAARARGTIVLVDGLRLAGLMIDHSVGVTPRPVNIPRVDQDYFDEE